jgi:D-alanyl-D-alanine carboxypeptidase (penicillin-binding protein 5/6)
LKNGSEFVMNSSNPFSNEETTGRKRMMYLLKGVRLLVLFMVLVLLIFPDQTVSKPVRTPLKSKSPAVKMAGPSSAEAAQKEEGGLQFDAKPALLMDGLTGQILYEQDVHQRIAPASFVKILTLYLAFDALRSGQLKVDELVTVSDKAWRTKGSKMFLKVGERVKVEDLLKGIVVASGNDACVALSEHMAGTEEVFVSRMNEKARQLGLKDSRFMNSHGMPAEGQYTTAFDMALLARRYIEDHPEALPLHATTEFEYNGIRQANRNTLLQKYLGVDGLKTGHIEESGYHLIATAKRDGQRMIAVVMGCPRNRTRIEEAQKLLDYGFKNFSTVEAVKQGASFGPIRVKWGKVKEILVTAAEGVKVTVQKGKEKSVLVVPKMPPHVVAPIAKNQPLAKALVQNDGKVVKEIALLSSADVQKSLLPPWPITLAGGFALALLVLVGVWTLRRPRPKKL